MVRCLLFLAAPRLLLLLIVSLFLWMHLSFPKICLGDVVSVTINTGAKEIYFGEQNIGDAGALKIAEELRGNKILEKLGLSLNRISDKGAVAIAEALKVNDVLQDLMLGGNQITDTGAIALGDALQVNKALQTLSLAQNQISDKGAVALAEALVGSKTLKTLILFGNIKVTEKSVPILKEMLQFSGIISMRSSSGDPFEGTSISDISQRDLEAIIALPVEKRGNSDVFLAECIEMGRENYNLTLAKLVFELATNNQEYGNHILEFKKLTQEYPPKGLPEKLKATRQSLEKNEKMIQAGDYSYANGRDSDRATLVHDAEEMEKLEQFTASALSSRKRELEMKLKALVKEIEEYRKAPKNSDSINAEIAACMQASSHQTEFSLIQDLIASTHSGSKVEAGLKKASWINDFILGIQAMENKVNRAQIAVSDISRAVDKLILGVLPATDDVLHETQSLFQEHEDLTRSAEVLLRENNIRMIVPDIDKQKELHKQRQDIRQLHTEMEEVDKEIFAEETKLVFIKQRQRHLNLPSHKNDIYSDLPSRDETRLKLHRLEARWSDGMKKIHELCIDIQTPSICRFPDLLPVKDTEK